jgi:zinc transport system permease protein
VIEPFLARALAAGIGLAIVAAPLGSLVVWNRMAYFGEAVAHASLIGVALALVLDVNPAAGIIAATLAAGGLVIALSRQSVVPLDSVLGLMHQGALAGGVIALAMAGGPPVDLMGYLFGDILAVTVEDLIWIYCGGALVIAAVAWLWQPLLRMAVNEELAAAEGVRRERVKAAFILLLALTVAIAIKIVGVLLVIAFLIVPAVAARPFATTPERMALLSGSIAVVSVLSGIGLSAGVDVPGGPSIVLVMTLLAGFSLAYAAGRRRP